ncbi:sortase [Streptomyces mirabilis]|nr:sortase [Streptomyces mirabilis]
MRRVSNTAIASVTVVALCSGTWLLHNGTQVHPPPQPSAAQAGTGDALRQGAPPPPLPARAHPHPSIGVNAPLMGLGPHPRAASTSRPPGEEPRGLVPGRHHPGERGTAIVAGHVDNASGPAVFYNLGALKKGSAIEVARRDGGTALFTVDAVEVYAARDFPDEKVYGAASRPELRVITCGGDYSKATGYQGNVVVFAHLTGSR